MFDLEFVQPSGVGRTFERTAKVRLGDASASGTIRPDAIARFLQDIATDDWADTGIGDEDTWVVRRTNVRLVPGATWPRYQQDIDMVTWCGGYGPAWAERRINGSCQGSLVFEAMSLWVPLDATGQVVRLRDSFFETFGEALNGRRVSGKVPAGVVEEGANSRPWVLREADLDVVGHVNNAALWQAITEVAPSGCSQFSVIHHGSVERGDDVELFSNDHALWLVVNGDVKVAAYFTK